MERRSTRRVATILENQVTEIVKNVDGSISFVAELDEKAVSDVFGEDAFLDWSVLSPEDQLKFFIKRRGFGWSALSEEEVLARMIPAEKMLKDLGVPFRCISRMHQSEPPMFVRMISIIENPKVQ